MPAEVLKYRNSENTEISSEKDVQTSNTKEGKESAKETSEIKQALRGLRFEIARARETGGLSATEKKWWLESIKSIKEAPNPLAVIDELHGFLQQNIEINQKKAWIKQTIEETLNESEVFSKADQELFLKRVKRVEKKYRKREIFLVRSLEELEELQDSVPKAIKKREVTKKAYTRFWKTYKKFEKHMPDEVNKTDFISQEDFDSLTHKERRRAIKSMKEKLDQSMDRFEARYGNYCSIVRAKDRWKRLTTMSAKLGFLARLRQNMERGTKERQQEKKEVEVMIETNAFSQAVKRLDELKEELHRDTYWFFGLEEMENIARGKLLERTRLVEMATAIEDDSIESAIEIVKRARAIEEGPDVEKKLAELDQRHEARQLFEEGLALQEQGQQVYGQTLIDQAILMDPKLAENIQAQEQKQQTTDKRNEEARLIFQERLKENTQLRELQDKRNLVDTLKRKQRTRGQSISEDVSTTRQLEKEKPSQEMKQEVEQKTVDLREQSDGAREAAYIRLDISREVNKTMIDQIARDVREDKRKAETVELRRGEERLSIERVEEILISEQQRVRNQVQQEVQQQHNVQDIEEQLPLAA